MVGALLQNDPSTSVIEALVEVVRAIVDAVWVQAFTRIRDFIKRGVAKAWVDSGALIVEHVDQVQRFGH